MALSLGNFRSLKIIDKTLVGIFLNKNNFSADDVLNYCYLLKSIGVDVFEIDSKVMKKIEKIPRGIDFLYQLNSQNDVEHCIKVGVKHCVIKWTKLINPFLYELILENNIDLTVEYEVENILDLYKLDKMLTIGKVKNTGKLRVKGLDKIISSSWIEIMEAIGTKYNLNIDVCPENSFSFATSLAVEAVMGGINTITASFMGYGTRKGYASIEEILMSIKLLMGIETDIKLETLPNIRRVFDQMTGMIAPGNKPVVGADIFKYESGIHVDAIEKEPMTYEPFKPNEVGQNRMIVIGENLVRKSVKRKLKDFGKEVNDEILCSVLESIRNKSIEMKRGLNDREIIDILSLNKVM